MGLIKLDIAVNLEVENFWQPGPRDVENSESFFNFVHHLSRFWNFLIQSILPERNPYQCG